MSPQHSRCGSTVGRFTLIHVTSFPVFLISSGFGAKFEIYIFITTEGVFASILYSTMENIPVEYIAQLVLKEGKSYAQISNILQNIYPTQRGFSERSVRRFCSDHNISRRSGITDIILDDIIKEAVNKVSLTVTLTLNKEIIRICYLTIHH